MSLRCFKILSLIVFSVIFPINGSHILAQDLSQASDIEENQNASISAYLIALDEAEANYGAYDESIADIYIGLGNAFFQDRNFEKAKDAYLRGMQIERVNNGLFDLSQVPYLNRLTDVSITERDWNAASNFLEQAYAIQERNYTKGDTVLSEALLALVDVHLVAYSEITSFEDGYRHLESAYAIGSGNFLQHLPDPGEKLDEYIALRERSVVINYEMAVLNLNSKERQSTFVMMNSRTDDSNYKNLANFYLNGRSDLINIIDVLEAYSDDPAKVASAYTDLADWYLLFNKTNSALSQYRLAYQIAQNHENGDELIQSMFSNPVMLPRYSLPGSSLAKEKAQLLSYSVTISKYGKAQAIELLQDSDGIPVGTLRRGRAYLKSARFRPLLIDEEPTAKKNHLISIFVQ